MTNFVTLVKELVDDVASAINGIEDFNPTIFKYIKAVEFKEGDWTINIIPINIEPHEITSHSSFPNITIEKMPNMDLNGNVRKT